MLPVAKTVRETDEERATSTSRVVRARELLKNEAVTPATGTGSTGTAAEDGHVLHDRRRTCAYCSSCSGA